MMNIANASVVENWRNGKFYGYTITANDGYVLHDKANDYTVPDPVTMEATPFLGYAAGAVSCGANYDFSNTTIIDGYTAYGSREFFARPESEVPADQIFGGVDNDHEVM